jgi:chitinase
MTRLLAVALALAAGFACRPSPATPPSTRTRPRVVGYLASWGVRSKGTRVEALPAERLTHLFYAFGRVTPEGLAALGDPCLDAGECPAGTAPPAPGGNFAALRTLKARHPHLRMLVSFGGWGGSAHFSDAALSDASRRRFAASAIALYIGRWPGLFDGIDLDWEYPVAGGEARNVRRPEDRENYTRLLAELRRGLDSVTARDGRRYELSIAASANPSAVADLEVPRLAELLDFVGVMTYDYHTGGRMAHFNAPLFAAAGDPTPQATTDSSVRAFLAAGLPREKLLTGVPFFGKSYGSVPPANDGLFQPGGAAPPEWRDADYRALVTRRPEAAGFTRHWSAEAQVPWLYDPARGVFITYEDSASIARKGDYVRERRLGGVIIWELGGDDGTLLRALSDRLWR